MLKPRALAARLKWISSTCPIFIREGTPRRVQHDIQRASVGQERHILNRKHTGNNTLVSVTAGHLIAHGDLSLLGNVDAYRLVHARGQLVAVLPCKYLGIHDDAVGAVRHL